MTYTGKEKLNCIERRYNSNKPGAFTIHDHFIMYFQMSAMRGGKFMIEYPIQRPQ